MTMPYEPNPSDSDPDGLIGESAAAYEREWSSMVESFLQETRPKRRYPKWGSAVLGVLICLAFWTFFTWAASAILANADLLSHGLGFLDALALGAVLLTGWVMLRAMSNSQS